MRSMVVIPMEPIGSHLSHFLQAVKDITIKHLSAVGLLESRDISVLRRLAQFDVKQANALALCPFE